MFSVTQTIRFLAADGSDASPAYVRTWSGLDKGHVIDHFERHMIDSLSKLNAMSRDMASGKTQKQDNSTDPLEVVYDLLIEEDGKKWSLSTFEWPGLGADARSALVGLADGMMAKLPAAIQAKEHKKP